MCAHVMAQTPQPFPRPGDTGAAETAAACASTDTTAACNSADDSGTGTDGTTPSEPASAGAGSPSASEVGFPIYPAAQFLASYDAGRGQRYYIYGTTTPFADVVAYYRMQLDERGSLVFKDPPTHMFEIGRFREETMAFPPGVTVKDWTSGGSQGYLNPKPKGQPQRFPTIVMIVPPQAAERVRRQLALRPAARIYSPAVDVVPSRIAFKASRSSRFGSLTTLQSLPKIIVG